MGKTFKDLESFVLILGVGGCDGFLPQEGHHEKGGENRDNPVQHKHILYLVQAFGVLSDEERRCNHDSDNTEELGEDCNPNGGCPFLYREPVDCHPSRGVEDEGLGNGKSDLCNDDQGVIQGIYPPS